MIISGIISGIISVCRSLNTAADGIATGINKIATTVDEIKDIPNNIDARLKQTEFETSYSGIKTRSSEMKSKYSSST